MSVYFRPIPSTDPAMPSGALRIAGGWTWATHAERLERGRVSEIVPVTEIPDDLDEALRRPRGAFSGVALDRPRMMGILNTTPDSFSDGGAHLHADHAAARAREMADDGVAIFDVGGESTRPGSDAVAADAEIARAVPVIADLVAAGLGPVSIDTRKAAVAAAAFDAGAAVLNDVSALGFDPEMAGLAAARGVPVVLMHARGDPKTMQDDPRYGDVLLDVYDGLAARIDAALAAGVARDRIAVDPGIGFGKTQAHNLRLLSGLSLFHGLGCPILVGASRKRFIGTITGTPEARDRVAGSVAVALHAAAQGVQMLRVHDTLATGQALAMWQATQRG